MQEQAAPVTVVEPPPLILERVPLPARGALWALVVQDHYVEVVTERGRTLVLMRLGDAIREVGKVEGVQIHRSHWVALDAVKRVVKTDGKVAVALPDGRRLGVSRGYMAAAREAGLVV
jgi:DNA-binding LytR/AlgR family response regulator